MKKALTYLCAAALFLAWSVPPISAADRRIVEDFDRYASTSALRETVIPANGAPSIDLATDVKEGETGGSLMVTVGTGWNVIMAHGIEHDWTGAKAVKFWVKVDNSGMASPETYTAFLVSFDEDPFRRWDMQGNLPYLVIPKEGEAQVLTTNPDFVNAVVLDDGFEGHVVIPFTTFGDDGTMNLSNIYAILFQTDEYFLGTKIYIDNIELLDKSPIGEPEHDFNVTSPKELDARVVLDEDALPYSIDLNIAKVAAGSNLHANLTERIREYYENPDFSKFVLYDMIATKAGTEDKASLKAGKQAEVTVSVPPGFHPDKTKILFFGGGEVTAVAPTVNDGKLTFKISAFEPFAIADETPQAAETDDEVGEDPDDNPKTADPFALSSLLAAAVCAAGGLLTARKKKAER